MRIFKTTWFMRFAQKESIADASLQSAVEQIENGQFDANLGGGVYKQRLARLGEGRSSGYRKWIPQVDTASGYRLIACLKKGTRAFFLYGFPKSGRANITTSEKNDLKKLAQTLFTLSDEQLEQEIKTGAFQEIKREV